MARDNHGHFVKGEPRETGRVAGTPNKKTKEQRDRISQFFSAHWDEFEQEVWPTLSPKDKKDTFVALANYMYPKLQSVDVRQQTKTVSSFNEELSKMVEDSSII